MVVNTVQKVITMGREYLCTVEEFKKHLNGYMDVDTIWIEENNRFTVRSESKGEDCYGDELDITEFIDACQSSKEVKK